jgi:inner membrane transporter RhtA
MNTSIRQGMQPTLTAAWLPYAALAASVVTFCLGTSFAKSLFPLVGAPGATAYRVGFSALILLIAMRPWRQRLGFAALLRIAPYGLALGAMNMCFYMALRTIPLGLAIAIELMGPLSVSLVHSRRPLQFAMIGVAIGGLVLLLAPWRTGGLALDPVGVLFALAAASCWAMYIVFGKRTGDLPSGGTVALGMTVAACLVVPIGIYESGAMLLHPAWLAMGAIAALLSSAIPYSLEMVALKSIPADRLGVLLSGEPAVAAMAGMLLLGEALSGQQWLAIAMVVTASIGMVMAGKVAEPAIGAS